MATAHAVGADTDEEFTKVAQRVATAESIVADAFRSAPSIVVAPQLDLQNPDTQPVLARASAPSSWLPSLQSMFLVAIVAFGFGVLAAALWGRHVRHQQRAATVLVRPAAQPVPVTEPVRPALPEATQVTSEPTVNVRSLAERVASELPVDAELRREVRRVSPDVRRCIDDLSLGAEVEVYFSGSDGRVSELRLRTAGLAPDRTECITQAVRQMQVAPFQRTSYKFLHRFSY
jgi:predicted nucleic acid-binding protein